MSSRLGGFADMGRERTAARALARRVLGPHQGVVETASAWGRRSKFDGAGVRRMEPRLHRWDGVSAIARETIGLVDVSRLARDVLFPQVRTERATPLTADPLPMPSRSAQSLSPLIW